MRTLRVGLALGGGAARGAAHIGILKVLERENIPIHIITGTSIGAIIGAMYSTHPTAPEIEKKARTYIESKRFKRTRFDFLDEKKYAKRLYPISYKFRNTNPLKKNSSKKALPKLIYSPTKIKVVGVIPILLKSVKIASESIRSCSSR